MGGASEEIPMDEVGGTGAEKLGCVGLDVRISRDGDQSLQRKVITDFR